MDGLGGHEGTGVELHGALHVLEPFLVFLQALVGEATANVRLSRGLYVDGLRGVLHHLGEVVQLRVAGGPVRVIRGLLLLCGRQRDGPIITPMTRRTVRLDRYYARCTVR